MAQSSLFQPPLSQLTYTEALVSLSTSFLLRAPNTAPLQAIFYMCFQHEISLSLGCGPVETIVILIHSIFSTSARRIF